MNKVGAQTDHLPSMLYDIGNKLKTEIDFWAERLLAKPPRAGIRHHCTRRSTV